MDKSFIRQPIKETASQNGHCQVINYLAESVYKPPIDTKTPQFLTEKRKTRVEKNFYFVEFVELIPRAQ